MLKTISRITALAALVLGTSATLHAEDGGLGKIETMKPRKVANSSEYRPSVGIKAGYTDPDGDQNSTGNFILDGAYQPYIPLSLGAEVTYENLNEDRWGLNLKAAYNFAGSGFLGRTFVGAATGLAWVDSTAYGSLIPLIGFDYPIRHAENLEPITLGAEARYAFVSSDAPDAFSLNGAVKYWF